MSEKNLTFAGHKCRAIIYQAAGVPVVFLHGYSYNSSIWQRLSVTELLVKKQVPFLAIDMPYGLKSECQPKSHDPEINVALAHAAVENVFGSAAPILVGASLGGHIALKYAAQFPVRGLLLVAPAHVFEKEAPVQAYGRFKFPVRIIWGSEDHSISGEEMRTLSDRLPNAKLITYEDAGHSAYTNQPDKFKQDLLELYASAE